MRKKRKKESYICSACGWTGEPVTGDRWLKLAVIPAAVFAALILPAVVKMVRVQDEIRARAELALQSAEPWPPLLADAPAVLRWAKRDALTSNASITEQYRAFLATDVDSADWVKTSMTYVRRLLREFPDPMKVTAAHAHEFFACETTGNAAGTRNKKLQAWTKFYAWLQRTRHLHRNPFAGIKYRAERKKRNAEIRYLSTRERAYMLGLSRRDRQGIAVWLGICLGLRRKEIFEAEWTDITWNSETFHLPETKTGAPRTLPIPQVLLPQLEALRKDEGLIVPWNPAAGQHYKSQSRQLLKRLARQRRRIPSDHIGFNCWRHTFASHLVQAGVSLSKVAYYLGDDEDTVRRHYSRFLPKDKKDSDIDLGFT